MQDYRAPLKDMLFVLDALVGADTVARLPGCEDATRDTVAAILDQAGRFAAEVLGPLNRVGDLQGCRLDGERVVTPDGWLDAYRQFAAAGWVGLGQPAEYGGQGLPKIVSTPVWEMWFATNTAFAMLPQLNFSQAEALKIAADPAQKARWLPKVVSGEWGATMNLTEPQAGSDLGATRCRAEPAGDGSYRVFGQKIFISYGEHELTENIVHLVLARLPDAPPGVRGLSLFLVPKYRLEPDGRPGPRNDVRCIAIEHKMGIHGSPTCTMSYGDAGGAVAELVGAPNRGLETMFIMMNEARFGVGIQGLGFAERAYQAALGYARERVQGRDAVTGASGRPILCHPDVKRMLLSMRARIMAMRGLLYVAGSWFDIAGHDPDNARAARAGRFVELLMPVAKGWCTETGKAVCDDAIQVFGGMGFVEETGIAQFHRDVRITTIYEGTTGIQANDLVGRKILRDGGASLGELIDEMRATLAELDRDGAPADIGAGLSGGIEAVEAAAACLLGRAQDDVHGVLAAAVPFLELLGAVCGGWQLARAACAAVRAVASGDGEGPYLHGIVEMVRFYMSGPMAAGVARLSAIRTAGEPLAAFPEAAF